MEKGRPLHSGPIKCNIKGRQTQHSERCSPLAGEPVGFGSTGEMATVFVSPASVLYAYLALYNDHTSILHVAETISK